MLRDSSFDCNVVHDELNNTCPPVQCSPDIDLAIGMLHDHSSAQFAFHDDVTVLRSTMATHGILTDSLSINECQMAIAHHILNGVCFIQ
jgi:hypothetical protein